MEDYRHLDSPRGPPPSYHARWDDDYTALDDKNADIKNEGIKQPDGSIWMQRIQLVRQRTMPIVEKVPPYIKNDLWPTMKKIRITKRQASAAFLLSVFAIMPCALMFGLTGDNGPFDDKLLDCGQLYSYIGDDNNQTVKGIEGLFIIDTAYGSMSFSLVKFIDVMWDLVVGRGVQLLAWYSSYIVFTDALLRVIERHPAPYRTFTHLCLEGASLSSMGALIRDMKRYRSRRSKWLFVYIIISTFYVLSLPTILSAMTGYVSTSSPFVTLNDGDSSEIVGMNNFVSGTRVEDGYKLGERNGTCLDGTLFEDYETLASARQSQCNCTMPNGTVVGADNYYYYGGDVYDIAAQCTYNFTNNTQQFSYPYYHHYYNSNPAPNYNNYSCNMLFNITLNNRLYKFESLNLTNGVYCYNNTAYDYDYLDAHSQCMPDTTNNTYKWGFSTMLSGVFVIAQLVWACSMYIVWQDAQWNSALVRGGYRMTQLRAAFSLSEAAQQRMGMENEELMRLESKRLQDDLYGRKTLVDYGMWERKKLPFMQDNETSSPRL